jgi:hypothetical protein
MATLVAVTGKLESFGVALGAVTITAIVNVQAVTTNIAEVVNQAFAISALDGTYTLMLYKNSDLTPANTYYSVHLGGYGLLNIVVTGAGTIESMLVAVPPLQSPGSILPIPTANGTALFSTGATWAGRAITNADVGTLVGDLAEIEADIIGLEGSNVLSVAGRTGAVVLTSADVSGVLDTSATGQTKTGALTVGGLLTASSPATFPSLTLTNAGGGTADSALYLGGLTMDAQWSNQGAIRVGTKMVAGVEKYTIGNGNIVLGLNLLGDTTAFLFNVGTSTGFGNTAALTTVARISSDGKGWFNGGAAIGPPSGTWFNFSTGGNVTIASNLANDNMVLGAKGAGFIGLGYGDGSGGTRFFDGTNNVVASVDGTGHGILNNGLEAVGATGTGAVFTTGGRINTKSTVADDNLILNAKGNMPLYFNYDDGTSGVEFYNGAHGKVASINGVGLGTFNGGLTVPGAVSLPASGPAVLNGGIQSILPAFAAADKYVTIDASGNLHKSAIGPAS